MEEEANDLKRQSHKICVILSGSDVPTKAANEDVVKIFCDAVKRKYSITIKPDELVTVHRRVRGDIIGKFIKTGPGTVLGPVVVNFLRQTPPFHGFREERDVSGVKKKIA